MEKELQDLAWRSLPSEFKEKVMNLYEGFAISREFHEDKMETNHNEYWRCAASERLLEDLFGVRNINIHNKSKPKFKVGDFVHCKTPEEEGIYRVLRVYSGVNINYYDCRAAFTDKLFLYRFYESDLEPSIGPDASHKQPDGENHPCETSHRNHNLSQDTANCDISRLQIAAIAMQCLLNATLGKFDPKIQPDSIAIVAVEYADALIRAEKGDNHAD